MADATELRPAKTKVLRVSEDFYDAVRAVADEQGVPTADAVTYLLRGPQDSTHSEDPPGRDCNRERAGRVGITLAGQSETASPAPDQEAGPRAADVSTATPPQRPDFGGSVGDDAFSRPESRFALAVPHTPRPTAWDLEELMFCLESQGRRGSEVAALFGLGVEAFMSREGRDD